MNVLAQFRRSQRLIRSVFAVFVLAWLQTALMPCVMAYEVTGEMSGMTMAHDSINHDSMSSADMPGMVMSEDGAAHHDCVYCPPAASDQTDHHSSAANCAYPHTSQADSRTTQQLEQLVLHAALIHITSYDFSTLAQAGLPPTQYLRIPIASRPLNLTYCKQLK